MKKVFTAVLCAVLVFCMSTGTVFAAENTMDKYSVPEIVQGENSREETEGETLGSVTALSTEVSEPADVLQTADTSIIANVPSTSLTLQYDDYYDISNLVQGYRITHLFQEQVTCAQQRHLPSHHGLLQPKIPAALTILMQHLPTCI